MSDLTELLQKYGDTIKEEINVKEVAALESGEVKKIFKPLGTKLGEKFGKDTGKIIGNGKQGNIEELDEGKVKVFDNQGGEWILDAEDYEIAYQGLEGENVAAEGNIIAKLDLEITPELMQEGIAREISRFLNQMRKDADYNVSDKVAMSFETPYDIYKEVITNFTDFLKTEALLSEITETKNPEGDIKAIFDLDDQNITFALKK